MFVKEVAKHKSFEPLFIEKNVWVKEKYFFRKTKKNFFWTGKNSCPEKKNMIYYISN